MMYEYLRWAIFTVIGFTAGLWVATWFLVR